MTSIEELANVGVIREEVKALGKKFVWHTLNGDDLISAIATSSIFDEKTRTKMEQVEKLARAIETIDGVSFAVLIKEGDHLTPLQKAREQILKWQDVVREKVFDEYRKLEEKQKKTIEDFAKNVQSPITTVPGGK